MLKNFNEMRKVNVLPYCESRKIMEDIAGNKMGLRRAIEIVRGGGLNEISRKNVY